jgi:hypothetical protein
MLKNATRRQFLEVMQVSKGLPGKSRRNYPAALTPMQ